MRKTGIFGDTLGSVVENFPDKYVTQRLEKEEKLARETPIEVTTYSRETPPEGLMVWWKDHIAKEWLSGSPRNPSRVDLIPNESYILGYLDLELYGETFLVFLNTFAKKLNHKSGMQKWILRYGELCSLYRFFREKPIRFRETLEIADNLEELLALETIERNS